MNALRQGKFQIEEKEHSSQQHFDPYELDLAYDVSNKPVLSLFTRKNFSCEPSKLHRQKKTVPRALSPFYPRNRIEASDISFGDPFYVKKLYQEISGCNQLEQERARETTNCAEQEPLASVEKTSMGTSHVENMQPVVEAPGAAGDDTEFNLQNEEVKISASQKVKEIRRRLKEQLNLHRELSHSCREIDRISREVRIFRGTQESIKFLSVVNKTPFASSMSRAAEKRAIAGREMLPGTGNYFNDANQKPKLGQSSTASQKNQASKSPASPTNPFLQAVLDSFSKSKKNKNSDSVAANESKKHRKEILAQMIIPEPKPTPYRRVLFVPRNTSKSDHQFEAFPTGTEQTRSTELLKLQKNSMAPSVSPFPHDPSGRNESVKSDTEISTNSEGISTPSIQSSVNVLDDVGSVSASSPSSESIEDDLEEEIDLQGGEDNVLTLEGNAEKMNKLLSALKDFYQNCQRANQIALTFTGNLNDARPLKEEAKTSEFQEILSSQVGKNLIVSKGVDSNTENNASDDWLLSVASNAKDVKRLKLFIHRLQNNLKAIDANRRLRAKKRKMLEKAQRLAKVRSQLKKNERVFLKDVADSDIEDLLRSASESGVKTDDELLDEVDDLYQPESEIEEDDIIEEDMSFSGDDENVDDEIADEVSGYLEDSLPEDELEDEVQDLDALSDVDLSSGLLDEIEDQFADRLAEVSAISDVLDEVENLPYESDEKQTGLIRSNSVAASDDDIADETSFAQKTSAVSDLLTEVSTPTRSALSTDADVETVYPSSHSSSFRSMSEGRRDEQLRHSLSSTDWFENDLISTKSRREKAVGNVVDSSTFTQLYDPIVPEKSENSDSEPAEVVEQETINQDNLEVFDQPTMELPDPVVASGALQDAQDSLPKVEFMANDSSEEKLGPPNKATPSSAKNPSNIPNAECSSSSTSVQLKELVQLNSWKEKEKDLIRQMLHLNRDEVPSSPAPSDHDLCEDNDVPSDSFAYHWGMVESLLQCRFSSKSVPSSSTLDESFELSEDLDSSSSLYASNTEADDLQ